MQKKIIIIFLVLTIFLASTVSAQKIKTEEKPKSLENVTIKGIVKAAVTCIPNPLPNATVIAEPLNPFDTNKYQTKTDSDGSYEMNIPSGTYKIYAEKEKYKTTQPRLWYIEKLEEGNEYNFSFMMIRTNKKETTNYQDQLNTNNNIIINLILENTIIGRIIGKIFQ